jgi:two-component system response regulator YesN
MKRIILVDDEPMSRQHIRESFPWLDWGYQIVGEAQNGAEALELCGQLKPDLALIDITMPVMDGFTLLDHMSAAYPGTKCIILTAHRDFTYAQKAVQKGAYGYILKSPVDLAETIAALTRASTELEKEYDRELAQRHQRKLVEANQYPLRKHFFHQLLTSVLTKDQEIVQRSSAIGINLDADYFQLLICESDPLQAFLSSYPETDQSLVEFSMLEIVRESMQAAFPGHFEILPVYFGRFLILITYRGPMPNKETYKQACRQIESRIGDPLWSYLKLRLNLAASPPFASPHRLKAVYQKTAAGLPYRYYQEHPRIIYADECLPFQPLTEEGLSWLLELAGQSLAAPSTKSFQKFQGRIKSYFLQMTPPPDEAARWFKELKRIFANDSHLPAWPDFHEAASVFDALQMLDKWFQRLLRFQSSLLSIRPEIARAMQYIQQHLPDELTLDSIALEVELSPSHLGHLFKKEIGTSVIDFVLEQRIELAKKYLAEGRYRNYELAERVGFRHYSYFSTMFKKMTGMSPNEYRRSAKTSILHPNYEN